MRGNYFRPYLSIFACAIEVQHYNENSTTIDNKQEVVLVMLDMSATFDTIDHELLLQRPVQRLQHRHGIYGTVLNWFRSYLSNRTQLVRIQEVESSDKILLYGVPQGSVLGPLLFTLFFAPLEDVIHAHELDAMMCADDTQLYITIGSSDQRPIALSKLALCINDTMISCTSNGLTHVTRIKLKLSTLQSLHLDFPIYKIFWSLTSVDAPSGPRKLCETCARVCNVLIRLV